jgi:hypothetical protein
MDGRESWADILDAATQQDIRWRYPMPTLPDAEAVYVWCLKAQEELGELAAALLGQLIGKEGRGEALVECDQLIAVLLRIREQLVEPSPSAAPASKDKHR